MTRIYLREYETTAPLAISREEVPIIRHHLRSRRGGPLAEVVYDIDGVKLRSLAQVGYVPVREDLQLVVMPKIASFDDFFYVMEKAGLTPTTFLDNSTFAALGDSERDSPLEFIIKALFQNLRLLKRDGFYKRSLPVLEQRTSVKGKIEVTSTLRDCLSRGKQHQVECSYFDMTTTTLENSFVKYTIWLLLNSRVLLRPLLQEAQSYWRLFADIPLRRNEQYLPEIERIVRRRQVPSNRSYYLDILSLCFLIVSNTTVVVKEGEDIRLSAFVIDMNRTFEYYIRNIITIALYPEFMVLNGNEEANKQFLFQGDRATKITPDILIRDNGTQRNVLLVGDTKYKRQTRPSDDDWYQIIAYSAALGISTGVLIYPSDTPRPPQEYRLPDHVIWVYYFSLNSPKAQEDDLINFLRTRSRIA